MLSHSLRTALQTLLAAALFFLPIGAQSDQTTEGEISNKQIKLENIKEGISSLLNRITSNKGNYQRLQKNLRKNEKEISTISRKILRNRRAIASRKQRVKKLKTQISEMNTTLDNIKKRMSTDLRMLHQQGTNSSAKLFLNMEDPTSLPRTIYFHKRVQHARERKLEKINATRQTLETQQRKLKLEQRQLAQLQEELTREKKSLDQKQKQRQRTLAELKKEISNESNMLERKQQEAVKLQQLITQLNQRLKSVDKDPKGFRKQKGRLKWPTAGKLVHQFNQKRSENGQLRWQGVVMRGTQGQAVNAVFSGQVVYSDWMTGFGNLLMIDHGGGYLSLYGHNQALLKSAGDSVNKGEQIATLGNSGGELEDALYFEIRHHNKPINPSSWCRR